MFNYNLKMIMKKVGLLLFLFLGTLSMVAQESGVSAEAGRKATFARNGFWDNWFIGAGAGATLYLGAECDNASFTDRLTVNPSLFVGKWFNPYIGARIRFQGGAVHTFAGNDAQRMYHQYHITGHVDFMFNFTQYIMKYNEKRFYNFIPTIGMGAYQRAYDVSDSKFPFAEGFKGENGFTLNASILNTFRFSDRLSAFIEIGGYFVTDDFNDATRVEPGKAKDMRWNGILTGTAGLMLKVGKVGFSEAVLMDQNLIDDLNSTINNLRAQNAELSKRPVSCPDCPPVKDCPPAQVVEGDYVPNVVFFRLNSANIDRNQEISIYNTAEYLKANPDAKVKIVGYADRQTGTADYNMKLSEKRAKVVAKALTEKYNINSNRITVEWKGSSEQPYKENAWNRVAIFFAD